MFRRTASFVAVSVGAAIAAIFAATPAQAQTTIFSDDFSGGNPVASTSYMLVDAGTFTVPQRYRVVNNPANPTFTNNYTSYFDHTLGTAAGSMMFFDGATDGGSTVYSVTTNLTAGTQYTFSFWGSAADSTSTPTLQLKVDSFNLGAALGTSTGTWSQFTTTYTPTFTGSHTFTIYDSNFNSDGNDGALDDIKLTAPGGAAAPEPGSLGFVAVGMPFAAALVARRREEARRQP